MQSLIANIIDTAGNEAQYDAQSKRLMSMTEILAWVLKTCVDEFKEFDVQFIMKNCFMGKPIVSQIAVDPDMPNRYVEAMNSEDMTIREHKIIYDVRFKVKVPRSNEIIELIVDIEIQKDSSGIHYIIRRGIYYTSRMISAQFGAEFKDSHYEDIKKVISIWICPATANYRQDSIIEMSIKPNTIYGNFEVKDEDADVLRLIVIGLTDGESENPIIRLLSVYLSADKTPEDKKSILEKEFGIKMTEEMEKEVKKMYAMSEALKEKTWEKAQMHFAKKLLRTHQAIPYVANVSELSEEVVREIADIVAKEENGAE